MIRYEVLPVDGIEDLVIAHVPREVKVTVTASPSRGLEATLSVTEHLVAEGYHVVPHRRPGWSATSRTSTRSSPGWSRSACARRSCPPATATEPGDFPDAASLLRALAGRHLTDLGITGYPESHHFISDETTIQAMFEKAPLATHIVSQICFDPEMIAAWVGTCASAAPRCRSGSASPASSTTPSCCGSR